MPLEILYGALVLFCGCARFEGAEIAALAGPRVHFSGIEPVFTGLQLSDHGTGLIDIPIFLQLWGWPIVPAQDPLASNDEIKRAIIAAVRFEDACFKYFVQESTDYWQRCVRAVALAAKESPGYLESTYQLARNDVAYYMK